MACLHEWSRNDSLHSYICISHKYWLQIWDRIYQCPSSPEIKNKFRFRIGFNMYRQTNKVKKHLVILSFKKATFYASSFYMHVNDGFSMVSDSWCKSKRLVLCWPQFSLYFHPTSAWYASLHLCRPWVHIALCEIYWSGVLQSEIWLLQGEHLPCTILICWMQWEAKINFHIVFSARRKGGCEEKPRRRSFSTKCISNKIPLLQTRATGRSGHLKGADVTVLLKRTRWEGESNIFSRDAYEHTSVLNSSRHFIKRLISSAWNHIGCCEDESFFSSLRESRGCNSNALDWARFGGKNKALSQDSMRFHFKAKICRSSRQSGQLVWWEHSQEAFSGLIEAVFWWW